MADPSRSMPSGARATSTTVRCLIAISLWAMAWGCGGGASVFRSATPHETYQGMCSMLAIQQIERAPVPSMSNIQDSSVQLMVSYSFEPRERTAPTTSDVNFYFLVLRERAGDVQTQLGRHAEIACEQVLPTVRTATPQVILGLPPIEGVQEVRQAPPAQDAPAVPIQPAGDPDAPPPPGLIAPEVSPP